MRNRLSRLAMRLLHVWFRLSRGLTLGVRGAVIDEEGHVLLVRHTYVSGWHLPGGGVEPGETALDALRREIREEANVESIGEPELHGIFHNRSSTRRDHVVVFVVRTFSCRGAKTPDREIAEARFFALSHPPDGTTRGTRARLDEIATGAPPAAIW